MDIELFFAIIGFIFVFYQVNKFLDPIIREHIDRLSKVKRVTTTIKFLKTLFWSLFGLVMSVAGSVGAYGLLLNLSESDNYLVSLAFIGGLGYMAFIGIQVLYHSVKDLYYLGKCLVNNTDPGPYY